MIKELIHWFSNSTVSPDPPLLGLNCCIFVKYCILDGKNNANHKRSATVNLLFSFVFANFHSHLWTLGHIKAITIKFHFLTWAIQIKFDFALCFLSIFISLLCRNENKIFRIAKLSYWKYGQELINKGDPKHWCAASMFIVFFKLSFISLLGFEGNSWRCCYIKTRAWFPGRTVIAWIFYNK